MTRDEAMRVAAEALARHGVQPARDPLDAEEAWVEVVVRADDGGPVRVRDARAWKVTYDLPPGPVVVVEDSTGAVLRVDDYH